MSQQIYRHEDQTSTQDGGDLNKQTKQDYECFINYRKRPVIQLRKGF